MTLNQNHHDRCLTEQLQILSNFDLLKPNFLLQNNGIQKSCISNGYYEKI